MARKKSPRKKKYSGPKPGLSISGHPIESDNSHLVSDDLLYSSFQEKVPSFSPDHAEPVSKPVSPHSKPLADKHIQFRISGSDKSEFERLCESEGFTVSASLKRFIKLSLGAGRLIFPR